MDYCRKNKNCKACRFYLLCKDEILDFNMLNNINELWKSYKLPDLKNKSISGSKKIVIEERYQE